MELTRNLMIESVARLNPLPPRCLDSTGTVAAAVELMRKNRVGSVLIVEEKKLVGIFTERDLLKKILAAGRSLGVPITAAMTSNPVSVNVRDSVRRAVERMQAGGYRHLPVVDERDHPVGMLSAKRIVRFLAEHFPSTVYNQPPDPSRVPDRAEGA